MVRVVSDVSGAPKCIATAPSISTLNVGSSANGGNLAYSDILAVLAKAAAVKSQAAVLRGSCRRELSIKEFSE